MRNRPRVLLRRVHVARFVNYFIARVASEVYGVEHTFARLEDADLIDMLEDGTVEPICPHALCLEAFCRIANMG